MGFLDYVIAFVFVLGVMVLVHELGHFLAARYFGVRVEAFAFGFGPRLFGYKRGDTHYKVCLVPLGGYVKMAGETTKDPTGDPAEFQSKPRWQRVIIALMGPVFNVVLALLLLAGLFMVRYERLAFQLEPPVIGYVAEGSAAEQAGIREGDTIVAIDDKKMPTWEAVRLREITAALSTVNVTIERDGAKLTLPVAISADESTGVGNAGWSEIVAVRLGRTLEGMPAEKAGIRDGDILVTLNGEKINSPAKVPDLIQQIGGHPITLEVSRDEQIVSLQATPVYDESDAANPAWRIGVELGAKYDRIRTRLGFVDAWRESVDQNTKNATLIFGFLAGLIEQRMSPKSLEGPIGIARLSGQAARAGWPQLVMLMAAISLNLGIFNLLPIPILDGGVITLLLLESVMRRDISFAVKERIVQVGLVFILLLFAFVIYNDIVKSLSSG